MQFGGESGLHQQYGRDQQMPDVPQLTPGSGVPLLPPLPPSRQQQCAQSSGSSAAADTAAASAAVRSPEPGADPAPDADGLDAAKAARKQQLLQEKNRRAQARFRERRKVGGRDAGWRLLNAAHLVVTGVCVEPGRCFGSQ